MITGNATEHIHTTLTEGKEPYRTIKEIETEETITGEWFVVLPIKTKT